MRFFRQANREVSCSGFSGSAKLYKNIIWVYMTVFICFAYTTLMNSIPDHIYIKEGEEIHSHFSVPVEFEKVEDEQEVFAQQKKIETKDDYTVVCKLFGVIPIKEMEVSVIQSQSVFVSGRVIGIYGQTSGVLVLDTTTIEDKNGIKCAPAENRIMSGDYILAVNDIEINEKEDLIRIINACGNEDMVVTVSRKGEYVKVLVSAVEVKENNYMLGIWVKDDMAGIGTMTFYSENGYFGALGHGIGDGETGQLLSMSDGSIYYTKVLDVTKGLKGEPGELEGLIYYGKQNQLGRLIGNDSLGIYGILDEEDYLEFSQTDALLEIGYKQEIESGRAYILSDVDGEVKPYEIEITEVDYQAKDSNKGIHFTVTDEELLKKTGGIVQGMSGSPIIQKEKVIGAVTHVLVNDPAKGYGIFVENMLEH